jgi:hypothetical protein
MLAGGPSVAHGWQPSTRAHRAWRSTANAPQIEVLGGAHRTAPPDPPHYSRGVGLHPRSGLLLAVGLPPRYPRYVASDRSNRGLQSVELDDERVRAGLVRLDEMSDAELRELVRDEPAMFLEAAEGIIARRRSGDAPA